MVKMYFKKSLSVLWLLLVLGRPCQSSRPIPHGCRQAVEAFLQNPTEETHNNLALFAREQCWSVFGSSNQKQKQLTESVAGGNRWAAKYLALHLRQIGGGNLEDALISLGQFGDGDMESLLALRKNEILSRRSLAKALVMAPSSLTDKMKAQLDLLEARKSKVIAVSKEDLTSEKAEAIAAIDKVTALIRRHNDEIR